MESVPLFNDLVGGVEVTVLDDFTGVDDELIKGETVTLMGEKVMTYIRTRKGLDDSSNSARMLRQRQYLNALYEKSLERSKVDETFILDAAVLMADYMVSDCASNQLTELAQTIVDYEFIGIRYIEGKNVVGKVHMEFYPEIDSIKKNVTEAIDV